LNDMLHGAVSAAVVMLTALALVLGLVSGVTALDRRMREARIGLFESCTDAGGFWTGDECVQRGPRARL
jgi:hypothetical protein